MADRIGSSTPKGCSRGQENSSQDGLRGSKVGASGETPRSMEKQDWSFIEIPDGSLSIPEGAQASASGHIGECFNFLCASVPASSTSLQPSDPPAPLDSESSGPFTLDDEMPSISIIPISPISANEESLKPNLSSQAQAIATPREINFSAPKIQESIVLTALTGFVNSLKVENDISDIVFTQQVVNSIQDEFKENKPIEKRFSSILDIIFQKLSAFKKPIPIGKASIYKPLELLVCLKINISKNQVKPLLLTLLYNDICLLDKTNNNPEAKADFLIKTLQPYCKKDLNKEEIKKIFTNTDIFDAYVSFINETEFAPEIIENLPNWVDKILQELNG